MPPDESIDSGRLTTAARIAGLSYVLVIALGLSHSLFVASPLIVSGDTAATLSNITARESVFRIGILSDTVLYSLVLVLSVALYVVLKEVDRSLALVALVLRSAEGIVGLVVTLVGGLAPLLLLHSSSTADPRQLQLLAELFLGLRTDGLWVVLILIGPGGAAFCYLFLKSRFVPAALAIWGILTYASMFGLGSAGILLADVPAWATNVLFAQGALFEVLFGLWLLTKAVDTSRVGPVPSSAA